MRRRLSVIIFILAVLAIGFSIYLTFPIIFGSTVAPLPEQYQSVIATNAKKYNVDSCLIAATIRGESNWNASAGSSVGARGLMQLMPGTAASMARRIGMTGYSSSQLNDPAVNVELGTALIRYNIDTYTNLRNILVAYNAGGGRVNSADANLPLETRYYIGKITSYYSLYVSLYPGFCTGPSVSGGPTVKNNPAPTVAATSAATKKTTPVVVPSPTPSPTPPPVVIPLTPVRSNLDPKQFWRALISTQ